MYRNDRSPGPLRRDPIDRPQSLAAIVADRLKQAILRREVALREPLSEEKIAAAMDVSRTPVREPLTILQMQGPITIQPRRGSVVFNPDAEELQLLVDYRLNMELMASRLALERDPRRCSPASDRSSPRWAVPAPPTTPPPFTTPSSTAAATASSARPDGAQRAHAKCRHPRPPQRQVLTGHRHQSQ